jgi:hypothetical protein
VPLRTRRGQALFRHSNWLVSANRGFKFKKRSQFFHSHARFWVVHYAIKLTANSCITPLQFHERNQYFVGTHDETIPVAMRVNNPDCSDLLEETGTSRRI